MSLSGSYDLAISANKIFEHALGKLQAVDPGETLSGPNATLCREALNMILKNIMGPNNALMPGLKLWTRKTTTLTLSATAEYQLKPGTLAFTSGGTYEPQVGDTITGATSSATATIIAVSVSTGTWAGGDAAGNFTIINQSGDFESENLDIGSNSNVCTIAADSDQSDEGRDIPIPISIISAIRRNSDDIDVPLGKMSLGKQQAIGDKSATGTPTRYLYERKRDAGYFTLDRVPSDTTDTIVITYDIEIDDVDDGANDLFVTKEYFRPLVWMLADELEPNFPVSTDQQKKIEKKLGESLAFANTFEPENSDAYFEPGRDD